MFNNEDGASALNVDYSMHIGEVGMLPPPPLQIEFGLTSFAGDEDVGHARARIHLIVG